MEVSAWAAAHRRRLREIWRSAGWPCHDTLELDLLAAGLLQRQWDESGRETLRVSDAGLQVLAVARKRAQAALNAHEALVARLAAEMQRAGRVVWRGLSLRAPLASDDGGTRWAVVRPDVFSIRHTSKEELTEPVVHEIKVSRADLLSDLRSPAKGSAYRALSSQCWYVLREGIADVDEVPAEYGVMFAGAEDAGGAVGKCIAGFTEDGTEQGLNQTTDQAADSATDRVADREAAGASLIRPASGAASPRISSLRVARPAPRRALRLPFATWMALARSTPEAGGADNEPDQAPLCAASPWHV